MLALVLTGKGMQALHEASWLATTPVAFPRIDWLGVFPSQQCGWQWQRIALTGALRRRLDLTSQAPLVQIVFLGN